MKRIVFHVGPGKCGTSSIQRSLSLSQTKPCGFGYRPLDPRLVMRISDPETAAEAGQVVDDMLRGDCSRADFFIYSHEVCFQFPASVETMVRLAAEAVQEVVVVGYCRPPADFLQSSYCQWMFRSPERAREVWGAVAALGLDPSVYTGLERYFLAAIASEFHTTRQLTGGRVLVDWRKGYEDIDTRISPCGAALSVGQLPTIQENSLLLEDFYDRCGIQDIIPDASWNEPIMNSQFDLDLVEALHIAMLDGHALPGPHDGNDFLERATANLAGAPPQTDRFASVLKSCVATMLWPSNRSFAKRQGLNAAPFEPASPVSPDEAYDAARGVQQERLSDPAKFLADRRRIISRLAKLAYDTHPGS